MKITIHRNPGLYGHIIDLSVFFDGEKICDITRNETRDIILPTSEGVLEVKMEAHALSKPLVLNRSDEGGHFICGVRWWAPFDPIGVNMLWPRKFPISYLNREAFA